MERVLYVASHGGHLDELVRLARRFSPAATEAEWVTFNSAHSAELLTGETVHLIREVAPKDVSGALAALPSALRILRRGAYSRVISTGAAVAVPFAIAARARRVPFHYVECATRSAGPSLSGRMLAGLPGTRLYTQHPAWAGPRWQYRGSAFDAFRAAPPVAPPPGGLRRVVVLFGTQRGFPFTRAAEALAKVLPQVTAPDAEILWQTGWTPVEQLGIDGVRMVSPAVLRAAIEAADLVVSHAGTGSALMTLETGRCPLLLPRSAAFGEHTDDHQKLLADELAGRALALTCDPAALCADDLLAAAAMRAAAVTDPAPFQLLPD